MPKLAAESKYAAPGRTVTVSLPALMSLGSASPSHGYGTDAEDAVLGVQDHLDAGRQVVGDERRQTDPEVHVGAVLELAGGAGGHLVAGERHQDSSTTGRGRTVVFSMGRSADCSGVSRTTRST